MNTTTTPVHPFERAKLGVAPFRCVGVTKETYQACPGAPIQPGTTCDYCSTGIMYAYWIVGADARKFKVGCDCVAKTKASVEGFKAAKAKQDKSARDARNEIKRAERLKARDLANAERARQFAERRDVQLTAFCAAEPLVCAYLLNRTDGFLGEMNKSLHHWGQLTEGQLAAVRKIMAQNALAQTSAHVGEIGKRIEGSYTITRQTSRDYGFPAGVRYWHLLTGADGNLYTYFGSHLGNVGEIIRMRATVKAHEDYQGTRQTALARPSNVETVAGSPEVSK